MEKVKFVKLKGMMMMSLYKIKKTVSEYDQEISQTADTPMAPRRRATQQSQDTRKTN